MTFGKNGCTASNIFFVQLKDESTCSRLITKVERLVIVVMGVVPVVPMVKTR